MSDNIINSSSSWDGDFYSKHSEWQFKMAEVAIQYIDFSKGLKILDIGCGDGRFTKHILSLEPTNKVLGVDPSPSMLQTAITYKNDNLSFILTNAENMQFDKEFERIVAFNSLHWSLDLNLVFNRIYNALKNNGKILVLVVPKQVKYALHKIIDQVALSSKWKIYFGNLKSIFSFQMISDWAKAVESSGLILENLKMIDASLVYKNKQVFGDSLKSWIPFGNIPEELRDDYIDDVVSEYVKNYPCDENGQVFYMLEELVIVASKHEYSII